jgi:hypothetical protein
MITCSSGKKVYATEALAEEALLEVWLRYNVSASNGPVAVYRCDDCGLYHLTSQGTMNAKLAQQLAEGKIKRQQEINFWEDKFKKH